MIWHADEYCSTNTVRPPLFIILATEIHYPAANPLNNPSRLARDLGKRLELEAFGMEAAGEERRVGKFGVTGRWR